MLPRDCALPVGEDYRARVLLPRTVLRESSRPIDAADRENGRAQLRIEADLPPGKEDDGRNNSSITDAYRESSEMLRRQLFRLARTTCPSPR